jgi:predicted transcriptional regulator
MSSVRTLRLVAERRRKPQSLVVREAISEYAAREDRLSGAEQTRRLEVLRDLASKPPTRPTEEVDAELADARRARTSGWARPSD